MFWADMGFCIGPALGSQTCGSQFDDWFCLLDCEKNVHRMCFSYKYDPVDILGMRDFDFDSLSYPFAETPPPPQPDEFSDPSLTPLPTNTSTSQRALAAITLKH